jgi:2-polyprenyl-3-methyl-5-hydroxy-6-metoxy-1,4-benzoquinol methylase
MSGEKIYHFHRQPMTCQEAQAFLDQYRRSIRRSFDRYTRILPHIPFHSYVLDFGCGWGTFTEMIHLERQCRVDGIDLDPASIQIACDLVREKEGLAFSVRRIQELFDETYDVVVSTQVAEHTLNPGNYLRECNRVLRMGGYLIISAPNILTPRYFLSILGRRPEEKFRAISKASKSQRDRTRDHVQAWDPSTFCRLLSSLGFEYETHEFMEGIALPFGKYWRRPWGLLKHWSYTMLFKMRKVEFIDIAPDD